MSTWAIFSLVASFGFVVTGFWAAPILWREDRFLAVIVTTIILTQAVRVFAMGVSA